MKRSNGESEDEEHSLDGYGLFGFAGGRQGVVELLAAHPALGPG